jgi:hypothetical protein
LWVFLVENKNQKQVYSAKYFGVAKINQAQLEDYAKRKGVSIEQAERLLSPNLE